MHNFRNIYSHGFVRASVCTPILRVADPAFNVTQMISLANGASARGSAVTLFPELGISAYTNDDLFQQDALLEATTSGLDRFVAATLSLTGVYIVGCPLRVESQLFNCAVVVHAGAIMGVVPKTYLPNYREFYEKRQFSSGANYLQDHMRILGDDVPFGAGLVFAASNFPGFVFHAEICEDVWTPIPPSTYAALSGATILTNLSASNITVGKSFYRNNLCAAQSGRCISAYLYSAAGPGESTTDLSWDGHAMIYENGLLLRESERFANHNQIISTEIDVERLLQERARTTSFSDSIMQHRNTLREVRRVEFDFSIPTSDIELTRHVDRFPYVPNDPSARHDHCYEAFNIQVHGLAKRLQSSGLGKLVIGVSGGLDSTHALVVAAKTMDMLGLPRRNILAYTMPGFATGDGTKNNALLLMKSLDVSGHEIDIKPSCLQMLKDIGHRYSEGIEDYDITFENVQAGERTSHLFRLANLHNALVLGTGDLSELALGWSTYGVGDHMSHYNVNASVPKTLIQHLILWVIESENFDEQVTDVLRAVLGTEISPELVPQTGDEGAIQRTEESVGPYALQDFNLYYTTRHGFRPSKIAFLSCHAWNQANTGIWPNSFTEEQKNEYDLPTIKHWLRIFAHRFFKTSQFKRSCVPNGPKVGSGGSLSPRGDWRAPSDSEATVWIEEIDHNIPDAL